MRLPMDSRWLMNAAMLGALSIALPAHEWRGGRPGHSLRRLGRGERRPGHLSGFSTAGCGSSSNLTVELFAPSPTSATSVVRVGSDLRVTHLL
ncbi:hypothetical protein [Myxococcus sp. AM010]|uniref:hypothetical protein n=1 Tax=Myxococcus sp. AM010 TaxID=2745138 RepID=UPI0020D07F62|nr:hypothetical protein [Myxococcus sp. AM010]